MTWVAAQLDDVEVGEIWRSEQADHKGWEIEITKVGGRGVEFRVLRGAAHARREGRGGKNQSLLKAVLWRDFVKVSPNGKEKLVIQPQMEPNEDIVFRKTMRTCNSCGRYLPIEQFDRFTGKAAVSQPEGRMLVCHACLVQKRADGVRRRYAERKAVREFIAEIEKMEEPEVEQEPEDEAAKQAAFVALTDEVFAPVRTIFDPPPAPRPSKQGRTLALTLLDLAAQAEALETAAAYHQLLGAARNTLAACQPALGVYVIDADTIEALRMAVRSAALDLDEAEPEQKEER